MNILGILKALVGAITAAFLALSGAGGTVPADQVSQIASTTDAVVQEAIQTSPAVTKDDVSAAYELGKALGQLKAQQDAITSQATTTMTGNTTAGTPTQEAPSTTATPTPASATPPSTPSSPAPTQQASQARIDIISPLAGKGLGREYAHSDEIKDESNYLVVGAVVYDDNGQPTGTPTVVITATDTDQNATQEGTGDVATIWPNGVRTQVPVYTYSYQFKTAGEHTITFSANGVSKSVTVQVK